MPVIVDEVVISVEVGGQGGAGGGTAAAGGDDRQAMVSECVERVMEILRQKGER